MVWMVLMLDRCFLRAPCRALYLLKYALPRPLLLNGG